jgi:hypothetical protein
MLVLPVRVVAVLFVLSGPAHRVHSHQQILAIFN